jgi:hypothetical protein
MASSGGDEYYNYEEQYSQGWGDGSANADGSAWNASGWDNGDQDGWNGEHGSWGQQPWQEGHIYGDQSYDHSSGYGVSNESGLGADSSNKNTYQHGGSVPLTSMASSACATAIVASTSVLSC